MIENFFLTSNSENRIFPSQMGLVVPSFWGRVKICHFPRPASTAPEKF